MMGQTFFEDQEDMHRIWFFPFASLVLHYEALLSKSQREKYRMGRKGRQGVQILFDSCRLVV